MKSRQRGDKDFRVLIPSQTRQMVASTSQSQFTGHKTMMRSFSSLILVPTAVFLLAGCTSQVPPENPPTPPTNVEAHVHPSEGPHHGDLIELGQEEYHAELVHNEDSVTIYILDSGAKATVPIEATEITINLIHDGKPEQFKLTSSPVEGDPEGKSSRFQLSEAHLSHALEHDDANAKVNVTINGKAYHGDLHHNHDHNHDHSH